MPKNRIVQETQIETRNSFSKVDTILVLEMNGKELPTLAIMGAALEEAVTLIQTRIKESYAVVPPRVS